MNPGKEAHSMEASSEQPTSRPKAKRTGKDSVFSDLFRIPHYQWKMVKALHPEWVTKLLQKI